MIVISIAMVLLSISVVCSVICNVLLEKRVSRLEEVHYRELQRLRREKEWKDYKFTDELDGGNGAM